MCSARIRDSEASQEKILDAAEKLFVEKGYNATSLRQVAADAAVAKSLIFHHFQTKAELWEQVKARRMRDFAQRQQEAFEQGGVNLERLTDAIREYFLLLKNDPSLVRLMVRTELEDEPAQERFDLALAQQFIQRLEKAQAEGLMHEQLPPCHVLALILSAVNHWFEARRKFEQWPGIRDADHADQAYLDTFIEILLHGVLPRKEPGL